MIYTRVSNAALPALNERPIDRWDARMLMLAHTISSWSKDPSTQVGAVIMRPDRTVAAMGYNGFPPHVSDRPERYADREMKLETVIHAELNAILSAYEPVRGMTLYSTLCPCARCAGAIIKVGITRVVAPEVPIDKLERWGKSFELMQLLFYEAKVTLELVS